MSIPTSTEKKLTKARTQLLLGQPFFGTLCLRLKLVPGDFPTMATNGKRIAYNPAFVESLSARELEAVLAHEVMHCALGHHCRRGQRDPELWNKAADFAINPLLVANGFTLPADALLDPVFANLSAEEIYARLSRNPGGGSSPNRHPRHCSPAPETAPVGVRLRRRTGRPQGRQRTLKHHHLLKVTPLPSRMRGLAPNRIQVCQSRGLVVSAKSWMRPTIKNNQHLRRSRTGSSTSGTLPPTRQFARRRCVDISREVFNDLWRRAANRNRTGAPSCGNL